MKLEKQFDYILRTNRRAKAEEDTKTQSQTLEQTGEETSKY